MLVNVFFDVVGQEIKVHRLKSLSENSVSICSKRRFLASLHITEPCVVGLALKFAIIEVPEVGKVADRPTKAVLLCKPKCV